jgi:sulfite reductase alpha subunit-like flavoprotein
MSRYFIFSRLIWSFIQDELYEYCYRVRRTILEVLSEFRHVQVPKDYVFDMFPPLRPREFSIASSLKVRKNLFFF